MPPPQILHRRCIKPKRNKTPAASLSPAGIEASNTLGVSMIHSLGPGPGPIGISLSCSLLRKEPLWGWFVNPGAHSFDTNLEVDGGICGVPIDLRLRNSSHTPALEGLLTANNLKIRVARR
jgi:hypothetical protein